ncbi:MAG: DM13 domain-containing protein [Puniceicoccales bacterium]|jgi:hypothetical protein|nr:DM13 domain-containing protein [Puniceicoccales bacterium]
MPISLVSLRTAFVDALTGRTIVDAEALKKMIEFRDDYNDPEMYIYDKTLTDDTYADYYEKSGGGYTLYIPDMDENGNPIYTAIQNLDSAIAGSSSLFLKVAGTNPAQYVDIYTLYHLDTTAIFAKTSSHGLFDYADTATRVTSVLYSLGCRQKKLLEQYTRDIAAIGDEQRLMGAIADMLSDLETELTAKDASVLDATELNKTVLPAEVVAFFIRRGILSQVDNGKLPPSTIKEMLLHLDGVDGTITKTQLSHTESFIAWTQLLTLVKHPELLDGALGVKLPTSVTNETLTAADAVTDMYNAMYWQTASDMDGNSNRALISGEHWVFDPRLRDKDGNILAHDGSGNVTLWDGADESTCIYFDGFSTTSGAPDYSFVWYSASPPSNSAELECGMAEWMNLNYGTGQSFLASPGTYIEKGSDGELKFTDAFKSWVKGSGSGITIPSFNPTDGTSPTYKIVGITLASSGGTTLANIKADTNPWPVPTSSTATTTFTNAYATMLQGPIDKKIADYKLTSAQVAALAEGLRIYSEQVNSDGTIRTNQLQQAQNSAQESITVATNLLKSIKEIQQEPTRNIH